MRFPSEGLKPPATAIASPVGLIADHQRGVGSGSVSVRFPFGKGFGRVQSDDQDQCYGQRRSGHERTGVSALSANLVQPNPLLGIELICRTVIVSNT